MNPHRTLTSALLTLAITATALAGGPSTRPGIGAIPYNDGDGNFGVTFRVWAPNAQSVALAGNFNNWNPALNPMFDEGDGYWSVDRPFTFIGAQYNFVMNVDGNEVWRNDARARRMTNSAGNSVVYDPSAYQWQTSGYSTPPWNETVIYEMHLGTFNPVDGFVPGSFDEAIQRLDYLKNLGINMIEIMPINEFPGDVSWGYNPSQPFSVESSYGGADNFKQFIDEAHARGIGVIVDIVYNHYGPTDLDLWQYDGTGDPWGGIYFYNDERSQTPWGDTRPNFSSNEVRRYIRDSAMMWLNEFQADGLRVDAVQYIRTESPGGPELDGGWSLMQWINDEVDNTQPWKLIYAEDLGENDWITKSTFDGGAGYDAQASVFFDDVRAALIAPDDGSRNMWAVKNQIEKSYNGNWLQRVIYTENHDEVANGNARVPEEIWPGNAGSWFSRKRSTLGGVLVLTSPGIPMMFQGQELLEDGFFQDTVPLDWSKLTTYAGINRLYRDLIHLRRNFDGATKGLQGPNTNVHHVNDGDKMIAYHRWDQGGPGDDVIVMCNFANTTWNDYRIGLPREGTWYVHVNTDATVYSGDYGNFGVTQVQTDGFGWDGLPYSASIPIGPYSAYVLSQQPPSAGPDPDLDNDGDVDFDDLLTLLAMWGPCPLCEEDLDENGSVDFNDLLAVLAAWS